MPAWTKYYYWQILPYQPVYYVFMSFGDAIGGMHNRIARVSRDRDTWYAGSSSDPDATGVGKTRDQAVDNLLEEIGGLG